MDAVARLDDATARGLDDDRLHAREATSPGRNRRACQWSGFLVCSAIIDRYPDYELEDVLIVAEPTQLRALADDLRATIIRLLKERAASTTELAAALGLPKGTVGHHLKVLESAGLIRVVRTRKVRALTEKYYGRVARLFVLKSADEAPDELRGGGLTAMMLRQGAEEALLARAEDSEAGIHRSRIAAKDVTRFQKRLNRLLADFHAAADPEGDLHILAFAMFRSGTDLPPREEDTHA
jgi:DNA-binding transcriptional ArsR family regulator